MHKSIVAIAIAGSLLAPAFAQDAVRFDRPVFTTDATVLCPRQEHITALRRAQEANDQAAAERIIKTTCRPVGPDTRLTVVAMPGRYDPDVEVRVSGADPDLPRGARWTLKAMLRN